MLQLFSIPFYCPATSSIAPNKSSQLDHTTLLLINAATVDQFLIMSSCLLTPSSDLPPNPLLCVFYSIFDDAIGPVLSSAYPPDLPLYKRVPTFDDFKAALKTPVRCPLSACYHSARKGDLTSPVPVPASGGLWKELVEYIITNHTSQPPNNVICVHVPPTSPGPGGITLISCPARLKSEIYDRNSFTFNISFFVLGKDASCYVDSCLRLSEALINAEKECRSEKLKAVGNT